MVKPVLVPFRWTGFGVDIRLFMDHPWGPMFLADDVCQALSIYVGEETIDGTLTRTYPGHVTRLDDVVDDSGIRIPLYSSMQVRSVAEAHPEFFTRAFLQWLEELLETLRPQWNSVRAAARPEEPALPELLAGRTYSMRRAAGILTRDPALTYGQQALFETLRKLGWIRKEFDIWVPTEPALQAGHLIRHRVPIRRGRHHREIYPQVRITRAGLEQLHTTLGGVAQLRLDDEPALTLLELNP